MIYHKDINSLLFHNIDYLDSIKFLGHAFRSYIPMESLIVNINNDTPSVMSSNIMAQTYGKKLRKLLARYLNKSVHMQPSLMSNSY